MIPTEEVSARRREIEGKLKQVGVGGGLAAGPAGALGLGMRPQPQRVAWKRGLGAGLEVPTGPGSVPGLPKGLFTSLRAWQHPQASFRA